MYGVGPSTSKIDHGFYTDPSKMNALVDACRDLDHVPGNLNDDHARTFFTTFPLDSLFGSVGLTKLPSMTVSTDAITNLNTNT